MIEHITSTWVRGIESDFGHTLEYALIIAAVGSIALFGRWLVKSNK